MPRPRLARPVYRLKLRGRVWTVTWTDPESRRSRAVSTRTEDREEAKVWLDQWLAGQAQPEPPPQPRISDILEAYLAARKGKVEAHDRLEYAAISLRRHVGNLEPHMLTPAMYSEKRAEDRVADGTIRREAATLRAALHWAVRQQPPWIARAPYVEMPPAPPPRDRWLSRAELRKLLDGCGQAHVGLFVRLAYHTASRMTAILQLTWDRVDLDARRIDYRPSGRRQTRKRRTTVALNATILTALRDARRAALRSLAGEMPRAGQAEIEAALASRTVIEQRGKPLGSIKKGFAAACRRAGIEDCSPHIIRHTAATHMVMAGVPLAEVARMLGTTEAIVEKVYGKWSPDYLRRAADALDDDFGLRLVSDTLSEK